MSTHPDPANRADRIREAIADANEDLTGSLLVRDGYLKRLQGMVYGDDPRQGYFEGSNFRHPELRFEIDFPTGWQTQNQKQAVVGISSSKDALVQLSLAAGKTLDQAAREFLGQQGLTAGSPNPTTINGNSALAGDFSAASGDTQLRGRAVWIAYGGTTYQVLGYGTSTAWSSHQNAVNATMNSFRALTDPAALNVQPLRIELVTLDRSMTLTTFAQRYPSEVPVETLALLNQVELTEVMRQGTLVKRVVRGR